MAEPKRFVLNAEQRPYAEHIWGSEDYIWNGRYCGKKIRVFKGKTSEWAYHRVRDKVLYVEKGRLLLSYGWDDNESAAATLTMTPDMAFHIPPGMWHKFQGLEETQVLELGTHHSDKDVLTSSETDQDNTPDDDSRHV